VDDRLVFRKSRWELLGRGAGLVGILAWLAWLAEATGERSRPALYLGLVVAALLILVILDDWRKRLILTPEGIALESLFSRRVASWDEVERVEVPWGGFARPPLCLALKRSGGSLLSRLVPRTLAVGEEWERYQAVVGEIVSRVPPEALSARLARFLAAPQRVPLGYRVALLVLLAASLGAGGYALIDALREGSVGPIECFIASGAMFVVAFVGAPVGREKPFKATLVRFYGLAGAALGASYLPALLQGHSSLLLLVLAALVGFGAVLWVLCLPVRVRASRASALVAVGSLSAIAPTWWLGVREPVPAFRSERLVGVESPPGWARDGEAVCVVTAGGREQGRRCLIFETRARVCRWFPVHDLPAQIVFLPDGRVLCHSRRFCRAGGQVDAVSELWVWEGGVERRIAAPPRLRVASEGFVARGGSRVVMLVQDHRGEKWELAFLDLEREAIVRERDGPDFSRYRKVRWAADGSLVFSELHEPERGRGARLALAAMAPGAGRPVAFYRVEAPDVWLRFSPDVRWALVALKDARGLIIGYELVDVVERRSQPLALLGRPALHTVSWSSDGKALAYATHLEGDQTLVVAYPSDRRVVRSYVERNGRIQRVALSAGGRLAACVVRGRRSFFIRIVETLTARTAKLRHWVPYLPLQPPLWSPVGQKLALTHYESLAPGKPTTRLYVYDFGSGW